MYISLKKVIIMMVIGMKEEKVKRNAFLKEN